MSKTNGTWFVEKFISCDSPTEILRRYNKNAAIRIVRSNWIDLCYGMPTSTLRHLDIWKQTKSPLCSPRQPRPTEILRQSYKNPTTKTRASRCHFGPGSESFPQWLATSGNQLPDNKPVIPTQQVRRTQQRLRLHPKNADSPTLITFLRQSYENPTEILRHCGFSNE